MKFHFFPIWAMLVSTVSFALEPIISRKGEEVLSENFSNATLSKNWRIQTGEWKAIERVMRSKQILADNHSAAARYTIAMQDGIYEMRFRLVDQGNSFHFGFDPSRGELDKRGHLFSVIVQKTKVNLIKHVDKNKPKEDPNEILATVEHKFETGAWYTLLVEKNGNDVVAQIIPEIPADKKPLLLKASHPTFHVKTPTLVFRCLGDGVEIDDIKVWKLAE